MSGWMPVGPQSEAIDALAKAMLRTDNVPAANPDEFHARVVAGVLIRELRVLGFAVVPLGKEQEERAH